MFLNETSSCVQRVDSGKVLKLISWAGSKTGNYIARLRDSPLDKNNAGSGKEAGDQFSQQRTVVLHIFQKR